MRWLTLAWLLLALGATAAMGFAGTHVGKWPEGVHLVGHLGLCGGMAWLTATVSRGADTRRAWAGAVAAMVLGVGIELLQLRYGPPLEESLYDLAMDMVGASAGLFAFGPRSREVGQVVSWWLHPLWVAPVGLGMLVLSASESWGVALQWTGVAGLSLSPALAIWGGGWASGRWSDGDLSIRTERVPTFVAGGLGLLVFAGLAFAWGPPSVDRVARAAALGALGALSFTAAGFKPSGHVGIPVALAALAVGQSPRAVTLFVGVSLVLAWARWTAGRHSVPEVIGGLALAVSSVGVAQWVAG